MTMTMSWIEAGAPPSARSRRRRRLVAVTAGSSCGAERLVVRLRPAAHHRRERMAGGAQVPARDPAALLELDRRRTGRVRRGRPRRGRRGRCRGGSPDGARSPAARSSAAIRLREVGDAQVREVDPAEQAVPVRSFDWPANRWSSAASRSGPGGIASTRSLVAEHLLVDVVDLAVADLEVAPDRAAQPARLGPVLGPGAGGGPSRRRGPRRPAGPTRPSRRTSRSAGRPGRPGGGRRSSRDGGIVVSQSALASRASKNRSTQRPAPQQCSQVVGQAPNFSPSSPIVPSRSPASVAWSRR